MALLDSCLCCSLMVASFVIGVYALVAYVIAFTVELWWIVESEGGLPAPAHLLCAGYFVSLVLCAVLLHGLTVRRSLCLVVWLVGEAALALPEAGMVFYMALHHWRLQSLYGLTEITCWACRLFINVAGVVSVQSLYSSWREESEVMRRLRDLNMSSAMSMSNGRRGSVASSNSAVPGLAFQNEGFVGSMSQLNGKPAGSTYAVPLQPLHATKLKRSASSASRRSAASAMSLPAIPMSPLGGFAGEEAACGYAGYPMAPLTAPGPLPPPGPLHRADSTSEFNAAAFDGMLAASIRAGGGQDAVDGAPPPSRLAKAQSLVDLSRAGSASRLGDYWRVETVTAPAAYMVPPSTRSTRSLDRRLRPRRAVSMADLGVPPYLMQPLYYRDAYGREYVVAPSYAHPGLLHGRLNRGATSKTSLGAASDDFRKYRDVAL